MHNFSYFLQILQILSFHNFLRILGKDRENHLPQAHGQVVFSPQAELSNGYFFRTKAFLGILHTGQVQSAGSSSKPKLGSRYT